MRSEAAELERRARTVETPCGDGAMVWRRWGAPQGRPPLVLLHGGGGSWEHWVRNVGALSADREVWCPDLPSFGDSSTAPPPSDVHAIARTTADGLDRLFPQGCPVDLAGFSFGGIVGALIASARPGRIGRLVIVGSTALGIPRLALDMRTWRSIADPAERLDAHRSNLRTLMLARHHDDDAWAVEMHARNVERARFNGRPVAATTLLRDSLGGVDANVFGIWGALDATAAPDVRRAERVIRERVPGLGFFVVEDAGHWVQYEAAQRFNEVLRAIVDGAAAGGGERAAAAPARGADR